MMPGPSGVVLLICRRGYVGNVCMYKVPDDKATYTVMGRIILGDDGCSWGMVIRNTSGQRTATGDGEADIVVRRVGAILSW